MPQEINISNRENFWAGYLGFLGDAEKIKQLDPANSNSAILNCPFYFELKTIFDGSALQSFTIDSFEFSLFWAKFPFPLRVRKLFST